jgi:SAM-dependent methyltransferase
MHFAQLSSLNLIPRVIDLMRKPVVFEPGEALFWNDPHIAQEMLKAHLDPSHDAASRRPQTIESTTNWLIEHLCLQSGDTILDLGCGPGLYAVPLAGHGMNVTGIDYSQNSIDYARSISKELHLPITYLHQDFLTIDYESQFDLVLQVYGELCVFSPSLRDQLLRKVNRALKPGGRFVFDVTTRAHRRQHGLQNGWYVSQTGFWKPTAHLVLESGFDYPEHDVYLDQYIVVEENGQLSLYRNWFLDYSLETLTCVLQAQGFKIEEVWSNLTGAAFVDDSEWIAVIASKST